MSGGFSIRLLFDNGWEASFADRPVSMRCQDQGNLAPLAHAYFGCSLDRDLFGIFQGACVFQQGPDHVPASGYH